MPLHPVVGACQTTCMPLHHVSCIGPVCLPLQSKLAVSTLPTCHCIIYVMYVPCMRAIAARLMHAYTEYDIHRRYMNLHLLHALLANLHAVHEENACGMLCLPCIVLHMNCVTMHVVWCGYSTACSMHCMAHAMHVNLHAISCVARCIPCIETCIPLHVLHGACQA